MQISSYGNRMYGSIGANAIDSKMDTKATKEGQNVQKSPDAMSMEEYKSYVDHAISQIPFHRSHSKITETVVISEEGYQAMKEDPAYEKWVFEHIQENRSVDLSLITNHDTFISGTDYEFIGASKEECWGKSTSEWAPDEEEKSGRKKKDPFEDWFAITDSGEFWECAQQRHEKWREIREEAYLDHKEEGKRKSSQAAARYENAFSYEM